MCTLIADWNHGLLLGMNRDESFGRRHTDYFDQDLFYSVDPKYKGTWLGISNHTGEIAALLNRHEPHHGTQSRGKIVPHVLRCGSLPEDLSVYSPFTLARFQGKDISVSEWNGVNLETTSSSFPVILTSSRYGVTEQKKQLLQSYVPGQIDQRSLQELLRSHYPEKGVFSVCKHGQQSESLSSMVIYQRGGNAKIYDCLGSPCQTSYREIKNITYK